MSQAPDLSISSKGIMSRCDTNTCSQLQRPALNHSLHLGTRARGKYAFDAVLGLHLAMVRFGEPYSEHTHAHTRTRTQTHIQLSGHPLVPSSPCVKEGSPHITRTSRQTPKNLYILVPLLFTLLISVLLSGTRPTTVDTEIGGPTI